MDVLTIDGKRPPQRLVVLMHGVGANKDDLAPIGQAIVSALPDTRVLLPNGPEHFEHGGPGFQWFSLNGITPANRAERVTQVLPRLEEWLDAERMKLQLTCEQLVVGGFSQGAIMALAAAARGFPCGKVIAFSGRLVDPVNKATQSSPTIFVGHGESDQTIPVAEGRDAAKRLQEKGYTCELRTYPGLGHGINNAEIASAIALMKNESF